MSWNSYEAREASLSRPMLASLGQEQVLRRMTIPTTRRDHRWESENELLLQKLAHPQSTSSNRFSVDPRKPESTPPLTCSDLPFCQTAFKMGPKATVVAGLRPPEISMHRVVPRLFEGMAPLRPILFVCRPSQHDNGTGFRPHSESGDSHHFCPQPTCRFQQFIGGAQVSDRSVGGT